METLKTILNEFDVNRSAALKKMGEEHFPNDISSDSIIASCFHPIADEVLYNGRFLISCKKGNSFFEFGIRVDALELYYNEEIQNGYEDKKMYHINPRIPYYLKNHGISEYPYFEFGSLNLHPSGIDITFENESKQYRASFLIRKFSIVETNGIDIKDSAKTDKASTHIFDYFFPNGVSDTACSAIHWKSNNNENCNKCPKSILDFRQNLPDDVDRGKRWQFKREDI